MLGIAHSNEALGFSSVHHAPLCIAALAIRQLTSSSTLPSTSRSKEPSPSGREFSCVHFLLNITKNRQNVVHGVLR